MVSNIAHQCLRVTYLYTYLHKFCLSLFSQHSKMYDLLSYPIQIAASWVESDQVSKQNSPVQHGQTPQE